MGVKCAPGSSRWTLAHVFAGIIAFTACSEKKDNPEVTPETPVFQLVAHPDFVFYSSDNTLYSTKATRADAGDPILPEVEAPVPGVEVNLSACTSKDYVASKLSVHIRTVNDVTVFVPAEATSFAENDANSLAIILKNVSATGVYGETQQSLVVAGQPVNVQLQFVSAGVNVSIKGVNQAVIDYLADTYGDGLTVEVWNYYKNVTREALRDGFNAGATVSFSANPGVYVNAFAKVPDYVDEVVSDVLPRVYSKYVDVDPSESYYNAMGDEKKFLYPYLDEALTQPLDPQYWVRPATLYSDGAVEFVAPSKYYLLKGHKNVFDCTVTPVGTSFSNKEENDASIPADVETTVYVIPSNYNVIYSE